MDNERTRLEAAATGLRYLSESEAPLTPFQVPPSAPGPVRAAQLLAWLGLPADTPVERQELAYFLRNQTREQPGADAAQPERARRFQELQRVLEQEPRDVAVFWVGQTQVQAYMLGTDAGGQAAGLVTQLVET